MRLALVGLVACAAAPRPVVPPTPPPRIALATIASLPSTTARLRLDDGGRPYLISRTTFVPLERLASGDPAKPFRIAGAAELEDAVWMDDGVIVLVVGQSLGVIGADGFTAIATLPAPHMRIAAAATDTLWLVADSHLYSYARAGALTEVLHVPGAISAVSGSLDRAFLAIGGSIVRLTGRATTELVFDGADPILALAATPTGVMFSTSHGVFVAHDRAVVRLTLEPASAIAVHGEDVFLLLQNVGVVRGALGAIERAHLDAPVDAAPVAMPEVPSPPARASFDPPAGPNDFKDLRLALSTGISSSYASGTTTGALTGAFALHLDRVWGRDVPGLVWSVGLGIDRAAGDLAHTGATIDNMSASLGLHYGFMIGDSLQIELGPSVELDGVALDQPFSSATAWGSGFGLGGVLAIHHVFISGLELGAVASYTYRWYSLTGSCTPCATPGFDASVTTSGTMLGLSLGSRY